MKKTRKAAKKGAAPAPRRRSSKRSASKPRRYWSRGVTEHSDALDLEQSVFTQRPAAIARSLKRSAETSKRRKSSPFRSAMSMLTFYANRAGKNLSPSRKKTISRAKDELRKLFGRSVDAPSR
ncbi:MAG TPA: DUF3175 domain-containing protein [Polyangiaceae bacterium]|jgi:hypothetical protein|nr:DUF3175 domain-containing protein [Polyangiaceae bacterium]